MLVKQRDRMTTSENMQSGQADKQMERSEEMWAREDERYQKSLAFSEQMMELDQARGGEFDRLFLTYMIQHHKGAVSMVKELFATYGAGQDELVFKFASDVNVDQSTEIVRMEKMLVSLTLGVDTQ